MKLELERDEVEQVLTRYATHTLGIETNTMETDGAGRVYLSWNEERNGKRLSWWARFLRWARA